MIHAIDWNAALGSAIFFVHQKKIIKWNYLFYTLVFFDYSSQQFQKKRQKEPQPSIVPFSLDYKLMIKTTSLGFIDKNCQSVHFPRKSRHCLFILIFPASYKVAGRLADINQNDEAQSIIQIADDCYISFTEPIQFLNRMQAIHTYNLLIIGRSGSGKSATTKLLTSNPAIKVANSLKEVTTEVNYYDGTSFEVAGQEVRFRILDIPGLDKINNRAVIRQKILEKLEAHNIALHAIVYVSSLTERDTIDENKLFGFLQQLPWSMEQKKVGLIPLFTKYDNLVIDSQQDDVMSTKKEFQEIFEKLDYHQAWGKRIYWINHTKSLEFKIKSYEEIREKYEKQVERLIEMIKRNKHLLTAKAIREVIEQEDRFILKKLFAIFQKEQVSYKKQLKSHDILLKVQVQPQSIEQSFTAVSASSIGIFISKVCQKEIASTFSVILMGVPIAIALLKLATESFVFYDKKVGQRSSGQTIMRSYQHICNQINKELEKQWKQLNERLEFKVFGKYLCCRVSLQHKFKFFNLAQMQLQYEGVTFNKEINDDCIEFGMPIPNFQEETLWNPEIKVTYGIRKFNEQQIMKNIQTLRKDFCSKI